MPCNLILHSRVYFDQSFSRDKKIIGKKYLVKYIKYYYNKRQKIKRKNNLHLFNGSRFKDNVTLSLYAI